MADQDTKRACFSVKESQVLRLLARACVKTASIVEIYLVKDKGLVSHLSSSGAAIQTRITEGFGRPEILAVRCGWWIGSIGSVKRVKLGRSR